MRFNFESRSAQEKRLGNWHKWFAWRPVYMDDTDIQTLVWLETIERRKIYQHTWAYRSIPTDLDLFI